LAREHVVELEAREVVGQLERPVDGREERQRPREVRGVAQQDGPLAQGLAHERELRAVGVLDRLLEVAHAAVDELRAAAARAGGEVGALHEGDLEPAARGVERRAGPRGAAADHEHVEALGGQPGEGFAAPAGRARHPPSSQASRASAVGSSMTSVPRKPPRRAPTTPGSFFSPATRRTARSLLARAARSGPLERPFMAMSRDLPRPRQETVAMSPTTPSARSASSSLCSTYPAL